MNTLVTMAAVMNLSACAGVQTGKLLGMDSGVFEGLIEIDIDTGNAIELHPFDVDPGGGGLAVAPDGTLFASFSADIDTLVIVDPETGNVTPVGALGFDNVSGLAFGPDGTLYGVDSSSDQLITIDPLTGEGTAVGITGVLSNQGLTFTPNGTLYLVGDSGGGPRLYTVDTDTGEATEVGLLGPNFWYSLSLATIGDVLYAHAYCPDVPPWNFLVTLDRETGEATPIGGYCSGGKDCPLPTGMGFLPGPGDVDRDGDVDLDDFAIFQFCFTGPLETDDPLPVECRFLDSDKDHDLDLEDFADFQAAFTGPNDDGEPE